MNLKEKLALALANAEKAYEEGNIEEGDQFAAEAETYTKALAGLERVAGMQPAPPVKKFDVPIPEQTGDQFETKDTGADALREAVNALRFSGDLDGTTATVLKELYGKDYRQQAYEEQRAFTRYMRYGKTTPGYGHQTWGPSTVSDMLRNGFSVKEIKSTMVEGNDVLGGYAVPSQYGSQIIMRLPGLTAVRGGGALVIQTVSKSMDFLKITGGGDQYRSAMRGLWGGETEDSTEDNFEVGLETVPVDLYTYKVPWSVSLLEDAQNLAQVFVDLVATTMAMDEDVAFITGDGANKPRGILPGSTNADSLSEVNTGHADNLTMSGLKSLRRGVASQYRGQNGSWIGNSDTGGDIEVLLDGISRPYFEYVEVGEPFMKSIWRESESMPDVSAGTYPLIYGNLSGYWIVERTGLAIQRYNDSNTGINKVEFQIRRRVGGRVMEPWKLAVQKTSA